jgi:hypothetical protein
VSGGPSEIPTTVPCNIIGEKNPPSRTQDENKKRENAHKINRMVANSEGERSQKSEERGIAFPEKKKIDIKSQGKAERECGWAATQMLRPKHN